jgi:hypothetical protein
MPAETSTKAQLRAAFEDYDHYLAKMLAESRRIKALAPVYWKEQGYLAQPRLEKLRASVLGD